MNRLDKDSDGQLRPPFGDELRLPIGIVGDGHIGRSLHRQCQCPGSGSAHHAQFHPRVAVFKFGGHLLQQSPIHQGGARGHHHPGLFLRTPRPSPHCQQCQ